MSMNTRMDVGVGKLVSVDLVWTPAWLEQKRKD
jgi:hypothetical protein